MHQDKVQSLIEEHTNAVVHQVASMAAVIALLSNKRKIDVSHLSQVKAYVQSKCAVRARGHKGGDAMPSDFYGYPHPAYSASHANGGVQVSTISWANQEARPAQGPQSGGGRPKSDRIGGLIKDALKDLNVQISKGALDELKVIIHGHLACLMNDIHAAAPITVKKLEKILKKSHHAAFH